MEYQNPNPQNQAPYEQRINRRGFLKAGLAGLSALALAGCDRQREPVYSLNRFKRALGTRLRELSQEDINYIDSLWANPDTDRVLKQSACLAYEYPEELRKKYSLPENGDKVAEKPLNTDTGVGTFLDLSRLGNDISKKIKKEYPWMNPEKLTYKDILFITLDYEQNKQNYDSQ